MIITATMVQVALSWAIIAFAVATVVLAVDKAKLNADLKEAKDKLDYLESQLEGEVKPRSKRSTAESVEIEVRGVIQMIIIR